MLKWDGELATLAVLAAAGSYESEPSRNAACLPATHRHCGAPSLIHAAQKATTTITILTITDHMVGFRAVNSLARTGGIEHLPSFTPVVGEQRRHMSDA